MREKRIKPVLADVCGTCMHYNYKLKYSHTTCKHPQSEDMMYVHHFEPACASYESNDKRKGLMCGKINKYRGTDLER